MRFKIIISIFLLFNNVSFGQNEKKDFYKICDTIPLIKQPKDMDCWITVTTMLLSWRDKKIYSVDEVANKLGDPWKFYFEFNIGLPEIDQNKFIKKVGLIGEPPASYTYEAYLKLLKDFGPIWIITGDEWISHAKILVGIENVNDYKKTIFYFINPATGVIEPQHSSRFIQEYEDLINAYNINKKDIKWKNKDLRTQIYHF